MNREDIDCRQVVDAALALIFSARPDGFIGWLNRHTEPLLDAAGRIVRWFGASVAGTVP
jgi:hypothetical protein